MTGSESDWAPLPAAGRVFRSVRHVRLGDAGPDGRLRLDAVARYLQDVATDDNDDAGFGADGYWVVRETNVRSVGGGDWPQYGDDVGLTTWCGGLGRAWAIRRTDLSIGGRVVAETMARWVHLDQAGRPGRLGEPFIATYGGAAEGRAASARLPPPDPAPPGPQQPWVVRRADLDIIGHVNNAAVWEAVVEVVEDASFTTASVAHHGPIESSDHVSRTVIFTDASVRVWLTVDGDVRVTAVCAS